MIALQDSHKIIKLSAEWFVAIDLDIPTRRQYDPAVQELLE